MTLLLATLLLAAQAPATDIDEPIPAEMSKSEIREFNKLVDRTHPYYIRCVKAADTGSLVARRAVCRTNAQWGIFDNRGNDQARDVGDEMTTRSASSSN